MKRNYEALFGAFYEKYFDFKIEKMSDAEAVARTSGEFEGILNKGEMEKAVVYIAEGKIYLTHSKIFFKAKERLVEVLNSLDLEKLKLEITSDEYEDLLERRDTVLDEIDNKQIDYDPFTRWYYHDMEKEVRHFFGSIITETQNNHEVVERILERFENDCDNTLSENIIIKTTLAELLIKNNIKADEDLRNIKSELEQFNMEDIGQQLSEDEKIDLTLRIKEILSKLSGI
ncbi:hypothetical protein IAQ67_20930 [Paenibacillus peoriae]|uniref:Uncharacterized protein n=1 Tax=Paenibacillus peoriae TaxID=59893 RepID=A0A7H0Y5C5_9BACL|nr:Imm3 family immunity protein [Paenibacillus peoriae]QNR66283.1 hypothetical protein IAQ67_20930 [Paenibacillus peoriae]